MAVLLLSIIFISTIVSLPILQPSNAGALASTSARNINNLDWQIKSKLYYEVIANCFSSHQTYGTTYSTAGGYGQFLYSPIPYDQALNGSWFSNDKLIDRDLNISAYLIDNGAAIKCSNPNIINNAVALWGLDPIEVLCGSGFTRNNDIVYTNDKDNECTSSNNKNSFKIQELQAAHDGFTTYIQNKIYAGSKNITLGNIFADDDLARSAIYYILYRHSLNNTCIQGIDNKAPDLTSRFSDTSDNTPNYNDVSWVDLSSKSVVTGSYLGSSGWSRSSKVYSEGEDIGVSTCADLTKYMTAHAADYLAWANKNPTDAATTEKANSEYETPIVTTTKSCGITGIGWIVCPVLTFLADIADDAFKFLSDNFLSTSPNIFKGDTVFQAWSSIRSIANVAFVIVFLIIIFSQLTSFGIVNYGIKKLLPKLVIAAVMVNLSYYICQIAVDISNILGYSLESFFVGLTPGSTSFAATKVNFGDILEGVMLVGATGAIVWSSLAAIIPAIVAAVVALVMILFILIGRQALIILLIIISPLAFVAFLLPNTEKLYEKWQKTSVAMLMLFPIVATVFGASKLASNILTSVFSSTDNTMGQIAAAVVMVLPLFIVPGLLKKAMDGVGNIGTTLNSWGSKLGGAAGKRTGEAYGRSRLGQFQKYRKDEANKRRALTASGAYTGRNPFSRLRSYTNKNLNRLPGGFNARNAAIGVAAANKIEEEERAAAMSVFSRNGMANNGDAMRAIAMGINVGGIKASGANRMAAMQRLGELKDVEGLDNLISMSGKTATPGALTIGGTTYTGTKMADDERRFLASTAAANSSVAKYYGSHAANEIASGNINSEADLNAKLVAASIASGKYSDETIANSDKDALERLAKVANNPGQQYLDLNTGTYMPLTPGSITNLRNTVTDAMNNDNLHMTDQQRNKAAGI